MKIQSVEQYKGDTYCIILSNQSRHYIHVDIVKKYNLAEGREITSDDLEEIVTEHQRQKSRRHAMYILGARRHSRYELFKKLCKYYDEEIADDACALMEEYGYVNDEEFARELVESFVHYKRWGGRRIRFEMQRRGLSKELISEVLDEYEQDDFDGEIMAVLKTRYAGKLTDRREIKRCVDYFVRRGYSYGEIKRCLDEFADGENDED